ncbi:MAG TPA: diguanylate cyclase, partial [Armatimonadota bacterium]|nr:diguanylate cyclase [Armatimonadota bacterium]
GGDEFVILMPGANHEEAERVVERIRERVEEFNGRQEFPFPLRLSIGVREMAHAEDILAEADAAMYFDKRRRSGVVPHPAYEVEGDEQVASPAAD